tara:strand:+ start:5085 stop:5693 length:609 start_codon:yes stop_codon:yes gene_type:complete
VTVKDNSNGENLNKYSFLERNNICSNSRFDVFFDHVISNDNKEINDFLVVKPKVSHEEKIAGVCILPIYNNHFCLMKGWRHQFDISIYQAPTGFVESGEEPFKTAIRELLEETCLVCLPSNLISLGSFLPDAGLIEGRVALYLALDCIRSSSKMESEVGTGAIELFTIEELKSLIFEEKNIGGSTLVTSYRALAFLKQKKPG